MRRRTWWSVHNHTRLTVDNLLSVIRMQEDREDRNLFDISMIALSDFQLHLFPPQLRAVVDDCEVLRNVEYQKTQAIIFIEKTKLCQLSRFSSILNRVQSLVCGENIGNGEAHSKPRSTQDEIEKHRLWQLQLPVPASHQFPIDMVPTECERSIYLHQSWLRLIYLGSLYTACCNNPEASSGNLYISGHNSRAVLVDKCFLDIADVFDEIDCLELSEQLPCPTSALLILLLAYHKQLSHANTERNTRQNSRSLHKCWKILQKLKETSDMAARVTAAVEDATCDEICDELWASILSITCK
ncbi:uncharacterized protein N7479_005642 [Penicillium vulpinum]|nr:uncharacterized protein N7479_005642 [Penicillium vulpinum]KAJ5958492.1 hypothetical protein N7479_005642 [Penicillium vulpinum]